MAGDQTLNIVIVDCQTGNLFSVQHACKTVGLTPIISSKPKDILKADALILPGVGAFGDAMKNLQELQLVQPLKDFVASGRPFMGICLGMQILFSRSEEFGNHEGLNLIEGNVVKFPSISDNGTKIKVPQIGWNKIFYPSELKITWDNTPLEQVSNGEFMYFVHSYYACPSNSRDVLAITEYENVKYCSAIIKENIFATQFHPEKSAIEGIKIYRNWAKKIMTNQG